MSFTENLFVCICLVTGAFCLLVALHWIGLGVMRIRDRHTGKMGVYLVRRVR